MRGQRCILKSDKYQISMMGIFCRNSCPLKGHTYLTNLQLKAACLSMHDLSVDVNYFRKKAPSYMYDRVLNIPLKFCPMIAAI